MRRFEGGHVGVSKSYLYLLVIVQSVKVSRADFLFMKG